MFPFPLELLEPLYNYNSRDMDTGYNFGNKMIALEFSTLPQDTETDLLFITKPLAYM